MMDANQIWDVDEAIANMARLTEFDPYWIEEPTHADECEYVQHLAIFDYLRVGTSVAGRMVEYVDHLHEHFTDPVTVAGGRYRLPTAPGYSVEMKPESVREYSFPGGPAWR
jgi:L-fuconate dehydratase